jgi:hypothetical protein
VATEDLHGHILRSINVSTTSPKQWLNKLMTLTRAGLINMRLRILVAYGLIAATYIATVTSILFGCHPMHKNWQINPDPGSMSPFDITSKRLDLIEFRLLPTCRVQD